MYIAGEKEIYFIDRKNNVFKKDFLSFPSAQDPSSHLFKTLVDGVMVKDKLDGKPRFLICDILSVDGVKVGGNPFDDRSQIIQVL